MSRCSCLMFVFAISLMSMMRPALGWDESLSFRASSSGGIEAVVSGLSDGPGCRPQLLPPSSVDIRGSSISITSPNDEPGCFIPQYSRPYEVVAELGVLPEPRYDVSWTDASDFLHVSGSVATGNVSGVAVSLPVRSDWALILLAVVLLAAGLARGFKREWRRS